MATDDYMIGKPFPYEEFDLEQAIIEDENDEPAPKRMGAKNVSYCIKTTTISNNKGQGISPLPFL
ncbi:MAG: hypothetical protein K6F33_05165 [Bacteroidales bacterium]|nr:hypothetical protein [Bacteroidales bacterium]